MITTILKSITFLAISLNFQQNLHRTHQALVCEFFQFFRKQEDSPDDATVLHGHPPQGHDLLIDCLIHWGLAHFLFPAYRYRNNYIQFLNLRFAIYIYTQRLMKDLTGCLAFAMTSGLLQCVANSSGSDPMRRCRNRGSSVAPMTTRS